MKPVYVPAGNTKSQSETQDTVLAVWKCASGKGHLHKEVNSTLPY